MPLFLFSVLSYFLNVEVFIRVAKHEEDTHERLSIKNTVDAIKEARKVSLEAIEEECSTGMRTVKAIYIYTFCVFL